MKTLVLATGSSHKLKEFGAMLTGVKLLSMKDIGFEGDIDECGTTLKENAEIKARAVYDFCAQNNFHAAVVADDTGLFVNSLGGAPGVYSARYAESHNEEANRQKLLSELDGKSDRSAYFETCICYIDGHQTKFFNGKTFGKITTKKIGADAFGYDCLFLSDDLNKTFGEATEAEKNSVSHRSRAISNFSKWFAEN